MRVKYAGVVFELEYGCRDADRLFERYATDEGADEKISVTEEDLTRTFIKINDYGFRQHPEWRMPEEYLVSDAIHEKMCPLLLRHDVLVFHGAGLAMDNRGYVFLAPHYTGKTTHTRHWQKCFGERVTLIDEDKLLVKVSGDGIYVYGSSWGPETEPGMLDCVPLVCVVGLRRGKNNIIDQMSKDDAVRLVTRHGFRSNDPMQLLHGIELFDRIATEIPFASLQCIDDISAAQVAYDYLKNV